MTLSLLAEHLDVQERLRNEILDAMQGGNELDYDELIDLPFLDAVCRETLRLSVSSESCHEINTIAH